jgi:NADH-quinone oxidoreductase subunit J
VYEFLSQNLNLVLGLFAAAILGTAGLSLLLPHRHGQLKPAQSYLAGALLALIALGLLTSQLIGPALLINKFFFYAFALLSVLAGILMITSRDPINSALWFAVVILCSSGLFLLAGAQFIAAGTVIVYAGAIIVTFLFVIMLAQSHGRASYDRMARAPLVASMSSVAMLAAVAVCLLHARSGQPLAEGRIETRIVPAFDTLRVQNMPPGEDVALVIAKALPATAQFPMIQSDGALVGEAALEPGISPATRRRPTHVGGLGATLFIDHLVTVEVIGVILFVALIGAVSYATQRLGRSAGPTGPDHASA